MSFIQITDLHFVAGDELLYDMSPKARLAEGIALINEEHAGEDFVIITGDLTHFGHEAAYETLKDSLSDLAMPYHLLMGNHDSRVPFKRIFPDTPEIDGGFIQFVVETDGARIICLDTLNEDPEDHHVGRICETRLRWLDAEISATPADTRMIVAAHHPFFDLGVQYMDDVKLKDSKALMEVLEHRKPDMYLFGHIHRPISGVYQGIPFHTQRAFNHQVALIFERTPDLVFKEEPADIAIIRPNDAGISVFTRSVGGEAREFVGFRVKI
jgi:3',5'-cyclic-AMP phosphodiesterase